MCGIMGYYAFGRHLPEKNQIADMFRLLESRGTDASGFAYIEGDDRLIVHKAPIPASRFIQTNEWNALRLPKIMIFHTRLKTQGEPKNNMNNHPLFSKNGIAIVHNGQIYNDKEIFTKSLKRDAEVDSEAILAVLAGKKKGDRVKNLFDSLDGAFAIAAIDIEQPQQLLLIKKDNPLVLYYDKEKDILYFCSERDIIRNALSIRNENIRGFSVGEYNYHYFSLDNEHALLINEEGIVSYNKYHSRFDDFFYNSRSGSIVVQCPWCYSPVYYNPGKLNNVCEVCGVEICEEDFEYI